MRDVVADMVVTVIRVVVHVIIWHLILFNLGRFALLLVTLGRYPRGQDAARHENQLSLVGMLVLVMLWLVVVIHNNTMGA